MARNNQPDVFTSTISDANAWLNEISELADSKDDHLAYHALRATMHALRDRIPATDSAHFAAQLPTVLRGIYFENWQPEKAPKTVRNQDEFLQMIRDEYSYPQDADLQYMSSAVFETINNHVTPELAKKTRQLLNKELQQLWPEPKMTFRATPGEQKAPPAANPLEPDRNRGNA